jgi:hypothetical protein
LATLVALTILAPSGAAGQKGSAQRGGEWTAWLGCWQPVRRDVNQHAVSVLSSVASTLRVAERLSDDIARARSTVRADSTDRLLCVTPDSGGRSVTVTTLDGPKVVARYSVDASGSRVPVERGGCKGWETADWSTNGRRIYLTSEATCQGGVERKTLGMIGMTVEGHWIGVQNLTVGGGRELRLQRFRAVSPMPSWVPAEITNALQGREVAIASARTAQRVPISNTDVVDASRHLDGNAVTAWLVESGQRFILNADELRTLAGAGVPGTVTDAMVALTYPEDFSIELTDMSGDAVVTQGGALGVGGGGAGDGTIIYSEPGGYSPYGWGVYDPYGSRYRWGRGGWYRGPIVIVEGGQREHGKVVKGSGYSRDGSSGGDQATTKADRAQTSDTKTDSDKSTGRKAKKKE